MFFGVPSNKVHSTRHLKLDQVGPALPAVFGIGSAELGQLLQTDGRARQGKEWGKRGIREKEKGNKREGKGEKGEGKGEKNEGKGGKE